MLPGADHERLDRNLEQRRRFRARARGVAGTRRRLGEALTVNAAGGPVTGIFAGIDDSGALLIDDADGRQLSFSFGDVSLRRER